MRISRRHFIHLTTLSVGSYLLTACGLKGTAETSGFPTKVIPPTATSQPPSAATSQPFSATARVASDGSVSVPILGRPTDRAITANILSSQDTEIYFEYGTASGKYASQTNALPVLSGNPINILLDNLQPDTRYYYRLRSRATGTSSFSVGEEHTFVTQRASGSPFVFTIDADPHNRDPNFNSELYGMALVNALHDHPDFHINLGDTFMTEKYNASTLQDVVNSYTDLRPHLELICADSPIFLVNGNHEGELGWLLDGSDQNLAVRCTQTRQSYYPNPVPGAFYSGSTTQEPFTGIRDGYYAWLWGDALFVALDPFWYTRSKPKQQPNGNWGWTLGKAQYDWLKQTLENSQAKFKFIFIHNLVGGRDKDARGGIESAGYYEWGGKNQDGSWGFDKQRSGWDLPIHQLLIKNQVSVVFHGHDHVFVKQDMDGIVYQECPQPSITRYDNTQLAKDYGYVHGDVISSSGHLRVAVTAEKATVEYIRAFLPKDETTSQHNGQVANSYTIT